MEMVQVLTKSIPVSCSGILCWLVLPPIGQQLDGTVDRTNFATIIGLVIIKPPAGAGGLIITISGFQDPGGPGPRWPGAQDPGGPGPRLDHLDSIWWARPRGPDPLCIWAQGTRSVLFLGPGDQVRFVPGPRGPGPFCIQTSYPTGCLAWPIRPKQVVSVRGSKP